ncbi:S-layer homology domain-containing protein [Bacillus salitolerans]|uniref:S-layer homology domain-containing protein n=1 Tax=Bacillus salitolerans TaxID=1437434 RepID=A0ABW4LMP5_9BACI
MVGFRKLLVLVLLFVLGVSGQSVLATSTFKDVPIDHWAKEEIDFLSGKQVIKGYEDGRFGPENTLNRAHVALMIFRERQFTASIDTGVTFHDMNKGTTDEELYNAVHTLYKKGIINHLIKDGKFEPYKEITRAEMASILVKAYGLINTIDVPKAFNDVPNTYWAYSDIQTLYVNGITTGTANGGFTPEGSLTRSQFSAFISRVLDEKFVTMTYQTGNVTGNQVVINQPSYASLLEAMDVVKQDGTEVILQNNRIVWVKEGAARGIGKDVLEIFLDQTLSKKHTYIPPGYEMELLSIHLNVAKIRISGLEGYVSTDKLQLIPSSLVKGSNYYQVEDGDLKLFVYQNGQYYKNFFGEPLQGMSEGDILYSRDGIHFENGQIAYQYFQFLPLRVKTGYTGEQLDQYVAMGDSDSPLIGMGDVFKKAEEEYNVNAMYMLAHAILESDWGESRIAREKNNLFGLGAIDADPGVTAKSFTSLEECIMYFAKYISEKYLTPGDGSYGLYHGAFLGNKHSGLNVMYASDPYWGQKIAGRMYRIDKLLGGQERNKYQLALVNSTEGYLFVRPTASTNIASIYRYHRNGMAMAITTENVNGTVWHQIISEDPNYTDAFVHGDYVKFITSP